jgi:2-dehydropantoate 2-reductase
LARAEGVAVLAAAGIDAVATQEMRDRRAASLINGPVAGQARVGASTWQSIERGAGSVETDYLNGEIALLGRLHRIPTPANTLLQTISSEVVLGRRASGSVTEKEFLAAIE